MSYEKEDITKEDWTAYRTIQDSGDFNMFSPEAIQATGLGKNKFMNIVSRYYELEAKYVKEED